MVSPHRGTWICCRPNLPKVSSRTYSKKAWRLRFLIIGDLDVLGPSMVRETPNMLLLSCLLGINNVLSLLVVERAHFPQVIRGENNPDPKLLLMEEILHHLGCIKPCK